MATFLRRLYPLKIALVTVGLACSFSLPASSRPLQDPLQPDLAGSTAAVTRALQPPKNVEPPRIRPPAIPEKPIAVPPNLLSSKLIDRFPQFDGDGFFFVLSRTEASLGPANEVFKKAVIPFLSAMGFNKPATRFRLFDTSYQGRELPQADLDSLAKIICRRWWIQNDEKARQSCKLLSEPSNKTSEADASFKTRIGMTVGQFKKALERVAVEYFFTQEREVKASEHLKVPDVPIKVPLEHTGIRVEGRKGESGLFVTGRVINDDMAVTNVISIRPDAVLPAARKALAKIKGIRSVSEKLLSPVELLLLPYGGTGGHESRPAFKYAYRTALLADFLGMKGTFYLWLDAGTGKILQLVPAMGSATGKAFNRDPSSLPATESVEFNIDDPPAGGKFKLMLSHTFSRLDRKGDDNYNDSEVAQSSMEFDEASFSQNPTIQSVACESGNKEFAQVDLMATISRYHTTFNSAGPVLSFPRRERTVVMDMDQEGCNAYYSNSGFYFGLCEGYKLSSCPDIGDLNPAHDHTVVAHEFGHAFTLYQYGLPEDLVQPEGERPPSWCLGPSLESGQPQDPCPMPYRSELFHDFADAWSQVLEDTNCVGGWLGKNRGGTNFSHDCKYQGSGPPPVNHQPHDEGGDFPRLSEVGMTFDPNDPQDHFPEHRKAGQRDEYSDMQIAAAALWAVREGLKKREPAAGAILYLVRFVQTLATTGWLGQPALSAPYSDREIYRYLVEIEVKLASRWWAGSLNPGESTVNKVVSGFARAGIFMIRWACLDGNMTTPAGSPCESGADAVIDVEPGKDYLARSGSPPTFHIWTGPLYKFKVNGGAKPVSNASPSLCNTAFEVEIANDINFTPANRRTSTPASGPSIGVWKTVSNTSSSGCHTTWQPDASDWNLLKGTSGETYVYYRLSTQKSGGGNIRISTRPANGLFGDFDPPYVVVSGSLPE